VGTHRPWEKRYGLECGYRVDVVESVCDAINAAAGVVYDGIVIDCDSPNLDAHAVTAAIRQHETSRSRHIPTIALTTETGASAHDLCHVADVEVCVPKPVVLDEFDAVLAAWVPCMADSEGVSGAHQGA
jgi:CheY-like chemotaxis protein